MRASAPRCRWDRAWARETDGVRDRGSKKTTGPLIGSSPTAKIRLAFSGRGIYDQRFRTSDMKAPNLGNVDARYPGRERPLLRNLRFAGAHPLAEWGDQFVLRLRKPFGNTRK